MSPRSYSPAFLVLQASLNAFSKSPSWRINAKPMAFKYAATAMLLLASFAVSPAKASGDASCGIKRGATVYTGCGFTYQSKDNREVQCLAYGGKGGTSKFIPDEDAKSSCGIEQGQTVYVGCGYTYQRKGDRMNQCTQFGKPGDFGTSKFVPAH